MALTINTKIVNDANGYLLDAKNVKGSYITVSSTDELNALLTFKETVITGTRACIISEDTAEKTSGLPIDNMYELVEASDGTRSWEPFDLIAKGYYNSTYQTFFKESSYVNPIPVSYNRIYMDLGNSNTLYYFKDATDRYIKLLEVDMSNYYTKTETDNLLDKKVEMALGTDSTTGDNYIEITKGLTA